MDFKDSFCVHERYKTELKVTWFTTVVYVSVASCFYYRFTRANENTLSYDTGTSTGYGFGATSSHFQLLFLLILGGIFIFAVVPKKKRCLSCGHEWK